MSALPVILAIDQGTTSSRCLAFDAAGAVVGSAQAEQPQSYPRPGWVEHDPERIWADTLATLRQVIAGTAPRVPAAIGITNQRETTLLWDRCTGQ